MTRRYMSIKPQSEGSLLERRVKAEFNRNHVAPAYKRGSIWAAICGSLAVGVVLFMLFLGIIS